MRSGTYPARAAQAGVRLPTTIEADKPDSGYNSIFSLGIIYPPVTHWAWSDDGFLKNFEAYAGHNYKFMDFAGSGVVHVTGGVCALIGCIFIGPRIGRFTEDGRVKAIPGHSVPLASLGGFILLFGFLAFNSGAQVSTLK